MTETKDITSTRPYLIRALYEWCTANGLTPYVAVRVNDSVQVPREYVKNDEIVLNISFDATSSLNLGNDFIEFKARFAGVARDIVVPMSRVIAIYARENGQGMAFPLEEPDQHGVGRDEATMQVKEPEPAPTDIKPVQLTRIEIERGDENPEPPRPSGGARRPALKRVK